MPSPEKLLEELMKAVEGDPTVDLDEVASLARVAAGLGPAQLTVFARAVSDPRLKSVLLRHVSAPGQPDTGARRRFKRAKVALPVTVHAVYERVRVPIEHGVLVNLSLGGAGVLMERPRPMREHVALEFVVGDARVYVDGTVMSSKPGEGGVFTVGVEFIDPPQDVAAIITTYVADKPTLDVES